MTSNELSTLVTGLWSKVKSYISNVVSNKQDTLVSGTNIKTINNTSLLGSGNISISGGGSNQVQSDWNESDTNSKAYIQNKPTIPAAQVNADWNAASGVAAILNKPTIPDLSTYCPIIEDTRSSAVAEITGVAPFASLEDGQRIVLRLKYNTVNDATLNLTLANGTTTGNIYLYYRRWNSFVDKISGSYGLYLVGQFVEMFYSATKDGWICVSDHDSNTTYPTITQAEINAGTSTSQRVVAPKLLVDNFEKRHLYVDNSSDASVELATNTYNDLGTLTTWKPVTLPAAYNRGDEFVFRFECGDASLTPTLPSGVVMADNFDFSEMAVGVVYQVSIMDGVAAYLCITPNS